MTRPFPHLLLARSAFMVSVALTVATNAGASTIRLQSTAPEGFEELSSEREVVLDAFFGGVKIGEVRAKLTPGMIEFSDPDGLVQLLPLAAGSARVREIFAGELPSNVSRACTSSDQTDCGDVEPRPAAVILNEEQFRIDIFLDPRLLPRKDLVSAEYIESPPPEPSLVGAISATVSGVRSGYDEWHIQSRMLAAVGPVRLKSDFSASGREGLSFGNLVAEKDNKSRRYVAGLFWSPGSELIGRRKIIGIGVSTQLDTRSNRDAVSATPLAIFLDRPTLVEVLIDGRVAISKLYSAGNHMVDTSSFPNGSYEVAVRYSAAGRGHKIDRRFFSKGGDMAPLRTPLFGGFAGLMARSSGNPFNLAKAIFYQGDAAFRLNERWGVSATAIGTTSKAMIEASLKFQSSSLRLSGGALISTGADFGVLANGSIFKRNSLSLSFDIRSIKSRNGRPLLPVTPSGPSYSKDSAVRTADQGSYTQGLAILGYRFGDLNLRATGLYRRSSSKRASYDLSLAGDLPVRMSKSWLATLQAEVRQTETGRGIYLGVRVLSSAGSLATSGFSGLRNSPSGGRGAAIVGESQIGWSRTIEATHLSTDGAVGRDEDSSYVRATSVVNSPILNARADFYQGFEGSRQRQYSGTIEAGFAVSNGKLKVSGRDLTESAIMVSVTGGVDGQTFELLVDGIVRDTIGNGQTVAVYLPPYKNYEIRVRPKGGAPSTLDQGARRISLYPGTVAALEWKTTAVAVMFGQAISSTGQPVKEAEVTSKSGITRTDSLGYFQIETAGNESLVFKDDSGAICRIPVSNIPLSSAYFAAGEVACR